MNSLKLILNITIASKSQSPSDIILSNSTDLIYTFIVPLISAFGICTNLTNIVVFSSKNLKDVTFKYLRINALCNFIYLLICFFLFVARCGVYCDYGKTYFTQLYMLVLYNYTKGVFALLSNCILITVGLYRFLIVTNKNNELFKRYKAILSYLFLFSVIFYSPNLFSREIKEAKRNVTNNNITSYVYTYSTAPNVIGKTEIGKWLIIVVVTIFRGFISLLTLIAIDIITLVKLKKHQNETKKLKGFNFGLFLTLKIKFHYSFFLQSKTS